MSKVYQCDRCKTIFEPKMLDTDKLSIARKVADMGRIINIDIDLCPTCYQIFVDWLNNCGTNEEANND